MLSARRSFDGAVALTAMPRLAAALDEASGTCRFRLQFDRDSLGIACLDIEADAEVGLVCQRSLESYRQPLSVRQRIGLIRRESDEAGLPADYVPVVVPEDGLLRPLDLIEDELLLSIPDIPVKPGSEPVERSFGDADTVEEPETPNPFAALAALKHRKP